MFSLFAAGSAFLTRSWLLVMAFAVLVFCVFNADAAASVGDPSVYNHHYSPGPGGQGKPRELEWCSDSGTNRFVTNNIDDFIPGSIRKVATTVAVGSGDVISPMVGDVFVRSPDTNSLIKCTNVLLLPDCENKLMPASPFIRKGYTITYGDFNKVLLASPDGVPLFTGEEYEGLYYYRSATVQGERATATTAGRSHSFFGLPLGTAITTGTAEFAQRLLETHWAFGHLNFTKLRRMLGLKKGDDPDCASCAIGTSRQKSLSKNKPPRSTRNNHRLHLDLGFTKDNHYVFQLAVDDFSRESFLEILDSKGEAFDSFQKLQRRRDNDYAPYKLAALKTDNEAIYTAKTWKVYCEANGIQREFSGRHRHDQHGVAERAMQSIGGPFRTMMIHGNAPECDPDCLRWANVIRNNTGTKANSGWSPKSKAAGMKLAVNTRLLLAPIFCLCFAHVYEAERHKHGNRGIPCVYLGYDEINNAFKVKEWATGKRYYTADVTFHPRRFPYRANPQRMNQFLHQYDDLAPHTTLKLASPEVDFEGKPRELKTTRPLRDRAPSAKAIDNAQQFNTTAKRVAPADGSKLFAHNFGPDPETWEQAMESRYANEWCQARQTEKESFKERGVFQLVPRSAAEGKRFFGYKEVLKKKIEPPSLEHPYGNIEKFRYRLTIAAFTRMLIQGVDYEEKYASTVRWTSIKTLLAIAVREDYEIVLFDISTFFLYGTLSHAVFMEQPDGWVTPEKPKADWIWKVVKSMYGHPAAAHCSQAELKAALTANDLLRQTNSDDCIYVSQGEKSDYAALGTHVDDIPCIGTLSGVDQVWTCLNAKFKITEKVNPTVIVGVQCDQDRARHWLKLHQLA
jgi:hypothetical protein